MDNILKIEPVSLRGNFIITNNSEKVLELKYKKWYSKKAESIYHGHKINISPTSLWNNKFMISKNNENIGNIKYNWKGHISIELVSTAKRKKTYLLKSKGFWKRYFELIDESENIVLTLHPKHSMKGYSYTPKVLNDSISEKEVIEILIYLGFGANLYMSMLSSSLSFAGA